LAFGNRWIVVMQLLTRLCSNRKAANLIDNGESGENLHVLRYRTQVSTRFVIPHHLYQLELIILVQLAAVLKGSGICHTIDSSFESGE
jgi:hypothetical protein